MGAESVIAGFLTVADTALPRAAAGPIRQLLADAPRDRASGAPTLGALASLLGAVWALASTMRAMTNALNASYGVDEGRSFWCSTLDSLLLAAAVGALLVGALFLAVFGAALAHAAADGLGRGTLGRRAWQLALWPALALMVLSACALIYAVAPDVRQRPRWVSIGALLATALWLLFTVLYAAYANRLAGFEDAYGALTGVVALMAYAYSAAFILLLGGVMNQAIEESHPDGKRPGQREPARPAPPMPPAREPPRACRLPDNEDDVPPRIPISFAPELQATITSIR